MMCTHISLSSYIYIYTYRFILIHLTLYDHLYDDYQEIHVYIHMYIYSPGLGPGRVRSWAFCVYCNICYVFKATFTFLIWLQHFVRLFSNFYNFCYSCCSLFGQLLFIVQKVRARGGLSGSPWAGA